MSPVYRGQSPKTASDMHDAGMGDSRVNQSTEFDHTTLLLVKRPAKSSFATPDAKPAKPRQVKPPIANDNAVPPSEPHSGNQELLAFFREKGPAWERRLYAKLGRNDGEDAAQDVRSLVVVKTASIEPGASRAFAWSAAGWITLQYARSRSRRPTLVGEDGLEIAYNATQLVSTPYDMVETNDKLRVVLRAIETLRESDRAALVLSKTVPAFDCLEFYVSISQRAKNKWEASSKAGKRKQFSRARFRLAKRLCLQGTLDPASLKWRD